MIELRDIERARETIAGVALRTPLVRLPTGEEPEIWLKLETLQPLNSFKIRGAASVIRSSDPDQLARGIVAASTGNLAQAVAWEARTLGVPATVVVPDHAPAAKLAAIEALGARTISVPVEGWWQTLHDHGHPDAEGMFVDPEDPRLVAGNGTVGLEIFEDLPEVDAVLAPYGGGALTAGIASALRELRPEAGVYSVEPETAAPAHAALAAGEPVPIDYRHSWVDGCGGRGLMPKMWPVVQPMLAGALSVPLAEAAEAIRVIAQKVKVIAEGAGALPVAAALGGQVRARRIVCVVSGGNIDLEKVRTILGGEQPS